jgi:uncharacterized SAM-binding protein YcdF (DUF218 family)
MTIGRVGAWTAIVLVGLLLLLGLVLPQLLESRSYGLPFQRLVLLVRPSLENLHKPYVLKPGENIAGLIILGGNTTRPAAAQELLVSQPGARVIATGPGDREIELIKRLPAPPGRIEIYPGPMDTYEEASIVRRNLVIRPEETWLIVTSAIHMPRALAAFRANCLRVYPWPVYDLTANPRYSAPVVYHEIVALLVYVLKGRVWPKSRSEGQCSESLA